MKSPLTGAQIVPITIQKLVMNLKDIATSVTLIISCVTPVLVNGQQKLASYNFDLCKEKDSELFSYKLPKGEFGIFCIKSGKRGIYIRVGHTNDSMPVFSINTGDDKKVETNVPVHHDLNNNHKILKKSIPPSCIPVEQGILGIYVGGPRRVLISESDFNGKDLKISDELDLPTSEIFITHALQGNNIYFISCDRNTNDLNLYTKQWGMPIKKRTWTVDFSIPSNNGVPWRIDFRGFRTLFAAFYSSGYAFNEPPYQNGNYESYWRIRREIKAYLSDKYIHFHIKTGFNVTVLFSIPLDDGIFRSTIIDCTTKALNEIKNNYEAIANIPFKPSLGIYARNHSSGLIDSTVVITKVVDLDLVILYYHAFTGELKHAETYSMLHNKPPNHFIVDVDYYSDPKYNSLSTASRYFELLRKCIPEINLAKVDGNKVLVSVEILPYSKNEDMYVAPMLIARSKKDNKERPELLSLGRVVDLSDFSVSKGTLPKLAVPDYLVEKAGDFYNLRGNKSETYSAIRFENKLLLAVMNKEQGTVDIYLFQ